MPRNPDRLLGGLGDHHVWAIVRKYSEQALKRRCAPHDLRRTLAHLLRDNGAPIEQIQFTLGHESVVTTERYLGGKIKLKPGEAAVDRLKL